MALLPGVYLQPLSAAEQEVFSLGKKNTLRKFMIIHLESSTPSQEIEKIVTLLHQHRLEHLVSRAASQIMIGVSSPCSEAVLAQLRKNPSIQQLTPIPQPYKMASRLSRPEGSVIKVPHPRLAKSAGRFLEPVCKVAEADEEQGADGAQRRSVQEVLDRASTGATQLFAASVDCENRF
jgi:hypothetical protein